MIRKTGGGERGTALVVVLVVIVLLGALGVGVWSAGAARLAEARRRVGHAEARWAAIGAARAATAWLEGEERGSPTPRPPRGDFERGRRRIDVDGDGRGQPWSSLDPPHDVRYKEFGGALLRPPDGPSPENAFLGTLEGPDLLLDETEAAAAEALRALARVVRPDGRVRVTRVAFYAPPRAASAAALASVLVRARAGRRGERLEADARGVIVRPPWPRPGRAIVSGGALRLAGDARWERGEALAAGALHADPATAAGWPGGVPWLGPDRPLRDDADGDGVVDDADGDGVPDLEAWRAAANPVTDPWWRARVAGGWPGVAPAPASCGPARPFGPRDRPPRPPSTRELSGLSVGCAVAHSESTPVAPWIAWLAELGVRGARFAHEEPGVPGRFAERGKTPADTAEKLWSRHGGLLLLLADPARSAPLVVRAGGQTGALILEGADLDVEAGTRRARPDRAPARPRDTRGEARPMRSTDDVLPLDSASPSGDAWTVSAWTTAAADPGGYAPPRPPFARHLSGLVAATGTLRLREGLVLFGQARGGSVELRGDLRPVRVRAAGPKPPGPPARRPGPPGVPRVVLVGARW